MRNKDSDLFAEKVPDTEKQHWAAILFVWVGFIIVVGIMAVGGGLAAQQSEQAFITSVVFGNIILAALAAISGWIGAESGLSFNQMLSGAYPGRSARVVSLYVPIVLIGWFGVEAAIFGKLIGEIFNLSEPAQRAIMSGVTLLFSVSCYYGLRSLKIVSFVAVPTIVAIGIFALVRTFFAEGGEYGFLNSDMSVHDGMTLVIGSWVMGVLTCLPDVTRFCRSRIAGALVGSLGIFFANTFTFMVGGAGAALTGEYDPAKILIALGFVPLAVVLALANIWTTNDSNMYSAALNIAKGFSLSRRRAVIVGTAFAAIFAAVDPTSIGVLFGFLGFMGNTAPALGGVVLGSYLINRNRSTKLTSAPAAWIGWILGSAISILLGGVLGIALSLVTGFLLWFLVASILGKTNSVTG